MRSASSRTPSDVRPTDTDSDVSGYVAASVSPCDAILRDTGAILSDTLRINDGCFRIGGDEFAAILPETDEEDACRAVERCVAALAAAKLGEGRVGVSAGVAEHLPGESPESLIQRADAALYAAKKHGRNRVCVEMAPPPPPRSGARGVNDGL